MSKSSQHNCQFIDQAVVDEQPQEKIQGPDSNHISSDNSNSNSNAGAGYYGE